MFQRIPYWVQTYGSGGIPDQRAVHDFMECETAEMVRSLRNELIGLVNMEDLDEKTLDQVIGTKRRSKHGSYKEWAKMMLLWISSYKV